MTTNSNLTSTAEFIDCIKSELMNTTKSWKRIAQVFSEAQDQFSYSSDAFRSILKETGFSLATATKLVKIAQSDRLSRHSDTLSKIHAWTVLYAITTLTAEQFDRLLTMVGDGDVVTSSMVAKAKAAKKQCDPYKTVYTIRIDANALRGDLFDGDTYATLHNLIAEIQKSIPYIRIDQTNLAETGASFQYVGVQKQYEKLLKRTFDEAIATYKKNCSEWSSYSKNPKNRTKPRIAIYSDIAEANESFRADPKAAFEALGSDQFDIAKIWNDASQVFAKQTEHYAQKANTDFRYASSITPIEQPSIANFLQTTLKSSDRSKIMKIAA